MEKYPSRRLDIAIRIAFVITVILVMWRWPKAIHVSPSFNCAKAAAAIPTERLICEDPNLAKIDADFAIYYADNLTTVAINGDRATLDALVAGQRDFVVARNRCGRNRLCVLQVYGDREKQLRKLSGLPAPDFFGEVSVY